MTGPGKGPPPARPDAHARGAHKRLARELGAQIVGGRIPPGSPLRGEERFSAEEGVSRGAYREAIRILAAKGLVHSRTRTGTRVSDPAQWDLLDPDVLAWAFETAADEDQLNALLELRGIVAPPAAALAAKRRSDADLSALWAAMVAMAEHGLTHPEGRAAEHAFFETILLATANVALTTLSCSLTAAADLATDRTTGDPLSDHRAVFDAIAAGEEAAASAAMRALVSGTGGAQRLGDPLGF